MSPGKLGRRLSPALIKKKAERTPVPVDAGENLETRRELPPRIWGRKGVLERGRGDR